jgi:hypothetical protein
LKDALEYLSIRNIGDYALIGPVSRGGLPPKYFLVRMKPESVEEHRKRGITFKPAEAKCVETSTGARFCLITYDDGKIEGIEMCSPIEELKEIVEKGEKPTIERCREIGKNDFLVLKLK